MGVYTNTMRYTGLSGIDTDSIVQSMMKVAGMQYTALQQTTQKTQYTQDAYRAQVANLQAFYSSQLDILSSTSIVTSSALNNKIASTTLGGQASGLVTVNANSNSKVGSYSLQINNLASKDSYVGTVGSLGSNSIVDINNQKATGSTGILSMNGMHDLFLNADPSLNPQSIMDAKGNPATSIDLKLGTGTVTLNSNMSISDVVAAINDASASTGVKVSGDPTKGTARLVDGDGKAIAGPASADGSADTLLAALDMDRNGAISSGYTKLSDMVGMDSLFNGGSSFTLQLGTAGGGLQPITIDNTMTLNDALTAINGTKDIGLTLSGDITRGTLRMDSNSIGADGKIITGDDNGVTDSFFKAFGIDLTAPVSTDGNGTHISNAQDASYLLNGVAGTSTTNTISVNGTQMIFNGVTNGSALTIGVTQDTSGAKDAINKFVTAYNAMIDQLNTALTTTRPKDSNGNYFDPLTDDQKSAMSDTQISQWNDKAQQGFLYGDSILSGILNQMRYQIYQPVDLGNGQKISLYQIGITTTSNIGDGGKLQIDQDKLQAALDNNPGAVSALFNKDSGLILQTTGKDSDRANNTQKMQNEGLAGRLSDIIKMATSPTVGSITLKAGLDSSDTNSVLSKLLKSYTQQEAEMLSSLQDKENAYYNQFAAMEAAVTANNNMMAQLQSMVGAG